MKKYTDEELNALNRHMAVKVMRWTPVKGDYWNNAVIPGRFNCAVQEADAWAYEYDGGVAVGTKGKQYCSTETYNWMPATRADDALKVEERILSHFVSIEIRKLAQESYRVSVLKRSVTASTRALATCLLAAKLFP